MLKPFIAANWKMHKTVDEALHFVKKVMAACDTIHDRDIIIAPPFTALYPVAKLLGGSPIHLAAQNVHWAEKGAYTGEVSPAMLADVGCEYVIIGHSERRTLFGEKDSDINRKLSAVLTLNLKPIFCIGETLDQRDEARTFEVLEYQIREGLNNISSDDIRQCVIAYEPVWAIGTGKTATDEQAEEVHRFIRGLISEQYGSSAGETMRIIYGGSVNPANIQGLMAQPNINGVLVGGASLDVESFAQIMTF